MKDHSLSVVDRFLLATKERSRELFIRSAVEVACQVPSFFIVHRDALGPWGPRFMDLIHQQTRPIRQSASQALEVSQPCNEADPWSCDRLNTVWGSFSRHVVASGRCWRKSDYVASLAVFITMEEEREGRNLLCSECSEALYGYLRESEWLAEEEQFIKGWADYIFVLECPDYYNF